MNILETVGKYVSDANTPGLTLVVVPRGFDLQSSNSSPSPDIYQLDNDSTTDRDKLRQIRAEAVASNQMRVLFVVDIDPEHTKLAMEVDIVLSVNFGPAMGSVKVHKYRMRMDNPKDTYFIYEA